MFALPLLSVFVWAVPAQPATDAGPFVAASFAVANAQAQTSGKPVLLYFADGENESSARMMRETFADESVKAWLRERVVALAPEGEERAKLLGRFRVPIFPAVLVVSPEGRVRAVLLGYQAPAEFVSSLEEQLKASDPVVVARQQLDEPGVHKATARIGYGQALAQAGRAAEALEQFLQCLDVKDEAANPLTDGVRLAAVAELGSLAQGYPPAREALQQRRDTLRKRITEVAVERYEPALLAALNQELKETDDTLVLYRQMQAEHPESITTSLLKQSLIEALYEDRSYDRIAELMDVSAYARRAHAQHLADARCELPPGPGLERFRAFQRCEYAQQAVKYYEMLLGNHKPAEAAEVAVCVLEVEDTAQVYALLVQAALRAGQVTGATLPQVAQALRAEDALDVQDLEELAAALEQLSLSDPAAKPLAKQVRQRLKGGE